MSKLEPGELKVQTTESVKQDFVFKISPDRLWDMLKEQLPLVEIEKPDHFDIVSMYTGPGSREYESNIFVVREDTKLEVRWYQLVENTNSKVHDKSAGEKNGE